MSDVDLVRLNFSPQTLLLLNVVLGLVMFGVSLELKPADFRAALAAPRALAIGLLGHHLVFPAVTYAPRARAAAAAQHRAGHDPGVLLPGRQHLQLPHALRARQYRALGLDQHALDARRDRHDAAQRRVLGRPLRPGAGILREVAVNPLEMFAHVLMLLGVPLAIGLWVSRTYPRFTARAAKPFKIFSLVFFMGFVLAALAANWQNFLNYVGLVVGVVALHNALALATGYGLATATGLPERDRRAVSIECGIQNSGLGLILIFNFYDGLGGMAVVTAWWGIWHLVAGLTVATFWSRRLAAPAPA